MIEEILQNPVIQEMVRLYGRFEFETEIINILSGKYIELRKTEKMICEVFGEHTIVSVCV